MTDNGGLKRTSWQESADVFAEFYEHLYDATAKPTQREQRCDDLRPFPGKELANSIRGLEL
eukprot:563070-Pyramimonas_sp.AAC.1